ncbi:HRDC domain-containing protein, partial [Romboutsia sp.]|uniref:HRDC domain-containing protein n=1 Tax=Romboutsia sp. TaxID=1965302 RepID=UPI003F3F99ED
IEVSNPDEIRNNLKEYRLNKSKEENMKAFMVFNNETMEEIISTMPKNTDELQNVRGFGPVKIEKYGQDILNIIK